MSSWPITSFVSQHLVGLYSLDTSMRLTAALLPVVSLGFLGQTHAAFSHTVLSGDDPIQKAMWVDFTFTKGGENKTGSGTLTDENLEWVANNYAIVSLEKCLANPRNDTINQFEYWAAKMKQVNPDLKVLFYWSTGEVNRGCYAKESSIVEAHPEWWARNDSGLPVPNAVGPKLNSSVQSERDWWVSVAAGVKHADGYFADGAGWPNFAGTSEERNEQVAEGKMRMLDQLRAASGGRQVFGNLLSTYPQIPHGNTEFLPHVDGACAEHVGAFEQVLRGDDSEPETGSAVRGADSPGSPYPPATSTLNATRVSWLLTQMWRAASEQKKSILFRGWPGPVLQPINGYGPSWQGPNNPNGKGFGAQADAALEYSEWAAGLWMVVATERTYLSYNWWYNQDAGVYPCPRGQCAAPADWFPVFAKSPGVPSGPAIRYWRNGTAVGVIGGPEDQATTDPLASVCRREFSNVAVEVEVSTLSASLKWSS